MTLECGQGLFVRTALEVVAEFRGKLRASKAGDLVEAGEVIPAVATLRGGVGQGAEVALKIGQDVFVHAGSWRGILGAQVGPASFGFEAGRVRGE